MREEAQHAVDRAINDPSKETIEEAQRAIDQLPEDEAADRQFKDDLQSKLDAVRDHSQIHFKHTDETRKVAQMNLNPTVERLNDQKKTTGGVLGLDIGILELGLISAEQINKISDLNRHQVTVPEGHLLDGQVEVTVRSVLGGHAFKVHILKKQQDGQYKKVQTLEESSGSFLFMGKTAKVPFDTLDAGEYEFVLETGAGLTVVQVIPYHLTELQLSDYTNVSTKDSIVQGNVLKKQSLGTGGQAVVTNVNGQAIGEKKTIQGKYGQLTIEQNGTYTYTPASNPKHIGQVEQFSFVMKNRQNGSTANGSLQIRLNEQSVEWSNLSFTTPARIVEASSATFKVGGTPVTTKQSTVFYKKEQQKKFQDNDFRSKPITIEDTASELEFHVLGGKGTNAVHAPIHLKDEKGNTVQMLNRVLIEEEVWNKQTFTNVPKGTYYLYIPKQSGFNGTLYVESADAKEYRVTHKEWGTYEGVQLDNVHANLNDRPFTNFFSKDKEKTDIEVYGYTVDITKNGREITSSTKGYHRVPSTGELTVAADYGYLTIQADGTVTYEPFQELAAYGQKEVIPYKLKHLSGHESEATMTFDLYSLRNTDENDNVITSSPYNDRLYGKGGSDTLVYTILKEDATGGHGKDEWMDFTYGTVENNREADRLDLRQLFTLKEVEVNGKGEVISVNEKQQKVTEDNLHTFLGVEARNGGKEIVVSIDRDGAESKYAFTELITLYVQNPEDVRVGDVYEMMENGQILLP